MKQERKELFGSSVWGDKAKLYEHPATRWVVTACPDVSMHAFDDGIWEAWADTNGGPHGCSRISPLEAVKNLARALGWQDPSGEKTGVPIGTITKANHRPCNCGVVMATAIEYAPWCHSRLVEVAIDPSPTVCSCSTKDGKHANTCGALGGAVSLPLSPAMQDLLKRGCERSVIEAPMRDSPKAERAAPITKVRDCVETARERFVAEYFMAFNPGQFDSEGRNAMHQHGKTATLEWLARDLGLAPNADDETIKATVRKRLAGQFDMLENARNAVHELRERAAAAQRRVEDLLQDVASEQKENDELRGMVAEAQLENRKLRGKR